MRDMFASALERATRKALVMGPDKKSLLRTDDLQQQSRRKKKLEDQSFGRIDLPRM